MLRMTKPADVRVFLSNLICRFSCDRVGVSAEPKGFLQILNERSILVTATALNALVNPFSAGDMISLPAGFAASLCGADRGYQFVTGKEEKVEIIDVTPARILNYHNNNRGLFLPTIYFRLNDRDCEGDVTVDLVRINNLDTGIEMFN